MKQSLARHSRSKVQIYPDRTVKEFSDPEFAEYELGFYLEVPWACPTLLDYDATSIVIETLPVAVNIPRWRPKDLLLALLERLHSQNIHHRDAHVKNILKKPDGSPVLIDWECAIRQESKYSYDIHGPVRSQVPVPEIHKGMTPQWWGSSEPHSISRRWN